MKPKISVFGINIKYHKTDLLMNTKYNYYK